MRGRGVCVVRKVLFLLGEFADADLQWFVDVGSSERRRAGEVLIRAGATPDRLFILVDGVLSVQNGGVEIARLGPGEVVGEMSMLDERPPSVTLVSIEDCLLFSLHHSVLRARLSAEPAFAARFYRAICIFLANRLSRTDALLGRSAPVGGVEAVPLVSDSALEGAVRAGARFRWFQARVRAGPRE